MSRRPFFSIVIPTLNEEKYLPSLLKDLTKQTYTDFEVIHVDGSSDDDTVKVSSPYKKQFVLRTKVVSKRNVSFQRNTGGKMAKGKWVIFMDADNRLPRYFLQGIRYQLDKNPRTGVFTTWLKTNENAALGKTIENALNLAYELANIAGKEQAVGALIGVRCTAFKKIKFKVNEKIFEDSFFIRDCVAAGFRFKIFHEPRYVFSLRRLKKEGTFQMTKIVAKAQINYILGNNFQKQDHGYVMKGGNYYNHRKKSILTLLQKSIQKASKKQLLRAKNLLGYLQEL